MPGSNMSAYGDGRWLYDGLRPMLPPPILMDIWEQYEPILDGIAKSFAPVMGIMTGYYAQNIRIAVRYYDKLESPPRQYIWFNLYWMQFLAELLEAGQREQSSCFLALAHRCWRDLCDDSDPKQQDWWRYHEYRRRQFGSAEFSGRALREASLGVLFAMLHETAHLTHDYRVLAEELVNSDTLCASLFGFAPDKNQVAEIACDFCALNLCLGADASSKLVQDAGRRLEIALLSLNLISLFNYLLQVAPIRTSNAPVKAVQDSKTLMDMLDARVKPLSVMSKISQNSGMPAFDGIDIAGRINATGELMVRFLRCVEEDLLLESQSIEAYNRMEESQKPPCQSRLAPPVHIWTRRTFE